MRVLVREGAYARTSVLFYVEVVQEDLFNGSETLNISPHIGRTFVGLQHRVARRLTGHQPRKLLYGMWVYSLMAEVKAEEFLHEVDTYISRRQNTVSQYIITRSIIKLGVLLERAGVFRGKMLINRWCCNNY